MKFILTATSVWSGENILKKYPILEKYNIEQNYKTYITINSLEDLIKLSKDVENELIIDEDNIEIYDDYRE